MRVVLLTRANRLVTTAGGSTCYVGTVRTVNVEAWAIAGVVVGAVLSTVGQVVNGWLQRRWAKDDRAADEAQRTIEARTSAFVEALDSIAQLTGELARSGVEEWGEWEDTGSGGMEAKQILNPENAVAPEALAQLLSALSKLRLYVEDPILEVDDLTAEITEYLARWHDFSLRKHPDPLIKRLSKLSKSIGSLYRERTHWGT